MLHLLRNKTSQKAIAIAYYYIYSLSLLCLFYKKLLYVKSMKIFKQSRAKVFNAI